MSARKYIESQLRLSDMSDAQLVESFSRAAKRERIATANLIEHIREFSSRRLFLDHGCTSIFGYLTKKLGYSEATAQNRIDAARMLAVEPKLSSSLASGEINLTQISILAHGLRQKEKESNVIPGADDKRRLLAQLKNLDTKSSALLIAQALDLNLKPMERSTVQKDESVVLQITFSKAQMELIAKTKELVSHVDVNPSNADVIATALQFYLEKKDPRFGKPNFGSRRKREPAETSTSDSKPFGHVGGRSQADDADLPRGQVESEAMVQGQFSSSTGDCRGHASTAKRRPISVFTKRLIFKRDRHCQWRDEVTGETCESRFQPQIDHVKPIWAGGSNEPENPQVLCGIHNRLKFQREVDH